MALRGSEVCDETVVVVGVDESGGVGRCGDDGGGVGELGDAEGDVPGVGRCLPPGQCSVRRQVPGAKGVVESFDPWRRVQCGGLDRAGVAPGQV